MRNERFKYIYEYLSSFGREDYMSIKRAKNISAEESDRMRLIKKKGRKSWRYFDSIGMDIVNKSNMFTTHKVSHWKNQHHQINDFAIIIIEGYLVYFDAINGIIISKLVFKKECIKNEDLILKYNKLRYSVDIENKFLIKDILQDNYTYKIIETITLDKVLKSVEEEIINYIVFAINEDLKEDKIISEVCEKTNSRNTLLIGPTGVGKTYNAKLMAVANIEGKYFEDIKRERSEDVISRFNEYILQKRILFLSLHENWSYDDLIEERKTGANNNEKCEIKSGIIKEFIENIKDDSNYVIIMDEINNINFARELGEFRLLIDESKRIGEIDEIKCKLPYSRCEFGIPKNLFIIATNNYNERFGNRLDKEFYNKFNIVKIMPDTSFFEKYNIDNIGRINLSKLLITINNRIAILKNENLLIGHSFFKELINKPTLDNLGKIFKGKIMPYLEFIFNNDYKTIQYILGDNKKPNESNRFILNDIYTEKNDYKVDKKRYIIQESAFYDYESYIGIYE